MKTLDVWLAEYSVSHQNPRNKRIHWVCVPTIVFSLIGMLRALPHGPLALLHLDWGSLFLILACLYYFRLSVPLFLGMVVVALAVTGLLNALHATGLPLLPTCLFLFSVAWIGQFWGHRIEGKKPSFFQDLQFLLIGPAWCLSFLYDRLGITYRPSRP